MIDALFILVRDGDITQERAMEVIKEVGEFSNVIFGESSDISAVCEAMKTIDDNRKKIFERQMNPVNDRRSTKVEY